MWLFRPLSHMSIWFKFNFPWLFIAMCDCINTETESGLKPMTTGFKTDYSTNEPSLLQPFIFWNFCGKQQIFYEKTIIEISKSKLLSFTYDVDNLCWFFLLLFPQQDFSTRVYAHNGVKVWEICNLNPQRQKGYKNICWNVKAAKVEDLHTQIKRWG